MSNYNFNRLKRLSVIYSVVQVCLLGLLLFMAYNFMMVFSRYGVPGYFTRSFAFAVAVQLICLYPAWWLAGRDVQVELEAGDTKATPEQLVALRRRRLMGDLWKMAALGAFAVFLILAPGVDKGRAASLPLAITYYSFLLVAISYFQSFNYIAKKRRKALS